MVYDAVSCFDPRKYDILFWVLVGLHVLLCFCDRCWGEEFFSIGYFSLLVQVSHGSGQGLIKVLGDL